MKENEGDGQVKKNVSVANIVARGWAGFTVNGKDSFLRQT